MRKNWKWIALVLLVFSITFIRGAYWLIFEKKGWISPKHLRVESIDTLESLPPVEMPITTMSEAIRFAYEKEEVHKWLYSILEDYHVPIRTWNITAHQDTDGTWKVMFLSFGIIPSTICVASFDRYGNEALTSGRPDNYCEWNK